MRRFPIFAMGLMATTVALAQEGPHLDLSGLPAAGTVSASDGLLAWDRINDVLTHPRCLNCHVGADNIPLWGTTRDPDQIHGMSINAGDSRIGAQGLSCNACHQISHAPQRAPPRAPAHGHGLAPRAGRVSVDRPHQRRDLCPVARP